MDNIYVLEDLHTHLYFNDILIGEHLCGSKQTWEQKYKTKENWAKIKIKERLETCERNIERINGELKHWNFIKEKLTS